MEEDWKAFLIRNKWAPFRLIKEKYPGLERYDLDNWLKKTESKRFLIEIIGPHLLKCIQSKRPTCWEQCSNIQ